MKLLKLGLTYKGNWEVMPFMLRTGLKIKDWEFEASRKKKLGWRTHLRYQGKKVGLNFSPNFVRRCHHPIIIVLHHQVVDASCLAMNENRLRLKNDNSIGDVLVYNYSMDEFSHD